MPPPTPIEVWRGSAKPVKGLWQNAQEIALSFESRPSN